MMFGIKFDNNEKQLKTTGSPKHANIIENSRNYSLTRKTEKSKEDD